MIIKIPRDCLILSLDFGQEIVRTEMILTIYLVVYLTADILNSMMQLADLHIKLITTGYKPYQHEANKVNAKRWIN